MPGIPDSTQPVGKPEISEDTRLKQWQTDARSTLLRLDEVDAEKNLPEGIDAAALAERRRDVEQLIRSIDRGITYAKEAPAAKKLKEDGVAAEANWNNFEKPGPYSILLADDLANQLEAAKDRSATYDSSISILQGTISTVKNEEKINADAMVAAEKAMASAAQPGSEGLLRRWQRDSIQEKFRLSYSRRVALTRNLENLTNQSAAADAEQKLLNRKLLLAKEHSLFTDDDLEKIQTLSKEHIVALDKERAGLQKRMAVANAARANAQDAFDKLPPPTDGVLASEERNLATLQLSVAETKVNSLQYSIDSIEDLKSIEITMPSIYAIRKNLIEAKTISDKTKPSEDLKRNEEYLNARAVVSSNTLKALMADISTLNSVSSSVAAHDPKSEMYNNMRAALWEKQAAIQRLNQASVSYQKMLGRWNNEFKASEHQKPWTYQVQATGNRVWRFCKQLWDLQIGGGDIKDGQIQQGVPLGKILVAVFIFAIGYFIATAVSKRVQRIVVARGHIAEAQANTLRNWIMIIVGCVLAFTTLQLLNIPLTLFAFFGGALAIGLGFGTQTLIKNFISGIIVLFERKIRVGDILTVGSVTGSIMEINTRSSVLRGADGRETLIPNSMFLENQVANLTLTDRRTRKTIKVVVVYGTQPQQVATILKECVERHGRVMKDPSPQVLFEDFTTDGLIFTINYWLEFDSKTDGGLVASDIRFMLEKRFGELGIHMSNTQREVAISGQPPATSAKPELPTPKLP